MPVKFDIKQAPSDLCLPISLVISTHYLILLCWPCLGYAQRTAVCIACLVIPVAFSRPEFIQTYPLLTRGALLVIQGSGVVLRRLQMVMNSLTRAEEARKYAD